MLWSTAMITFAPTNSRVESFSSSSLLLSAFDIAEMTIIIIVVSRCCLPPLLEKLLPNQTLQRGSIGQRSEAGHSSPRPATNTPTDLQDACKDFWFLNGTVPGTTERKVLNHFQLPAYRKGNITDGNNKGRLLLLWLVRGFRGEKKKGKQRRNWNLLSKADLWFVRVDKDPSMGKLQQEKFLILENETVCFQEKLVIIRLFLVKRF